MSGKHSFFTKRLMELADDFECLTHTSVEVRLKTNGTVSVVVKDEEDLTTRTFKFSSIPRAEDWFSETVEPVEKVEGER